MASDEARRREAAGVRIGMDGKRRWMDNIFIDRLWRTVMYEHLYLRAFEGEGTCATDCAPGWGGTTGSVPTRGWGTRPRMRSIMPSRSKKL